jgi:hypothetical protein
VADYGTATILVVDGKPTVTQADDVIGVTVDLLAECERWCFGPDGLFWLDPGGEYRYRPVRFATDAPGILVCERVASGSCAAADECRMERRCPNWRDCELAEVSDG